MVGIVAAAAAVLSMVLAGRMQTVPVPVIAQSETEEAEEPLAVSSDRSVS
jgi:hypothetical protein